ncbi:MAG: SRPBCC family protein [Nocardioides sp.]
MTGLTSGAATAIVTTAEIERNAADVFAYATDPTRFSEWQQGVVSGRLEGPPKVGTHCLTTRRIGGAERASTSVLAHLEAPTSWSVRGIGGPIRARVDVTVEPLSETRSRLTIVVDFEGHGIGRLLVPMLVRPQARKEMPGNLLALTENLESASVG